MQYGQAKANSPTAAVANPDSLRNFLEQINMTLGDTENLIQAVIEKIHGPSRDAGNKLAAEEPMGIAGKIMEINARAQRIRESIQMMNQYIG